MQSTKEKFGQLSAAVESPSSPAQSAIVVLHGVGSNEQDLMPVGRAIGGDRMVVGLRAPLVISGDSFAWFQVQFLQNGPVHNWTQAQNSFSLLEESLKELSKKSGIPLNKITVFGFSQGAIMTIGLALTSRLDLEAYAACSGRTLPEFAEMAKASPVPGFSERKILVAHGKLDSKLPLFHAKKTEEILQLLGANFKYREYEADHSVPARLPDDMSAWLKTKK